MSVTAQASVCWVCPPVPVVMPVPAGSPAHGLPCWSGPPHLTCRLLTSTYTSTCHMVSILV